MSPQLLMKSLCTGCFLSFLVLVLAIPQQIIAQAIPIGSIQDEQLRLQMLLNDSLSFSSINRPFSRLSYDAFSEQTSSQRGWWNRAVPYNEIELDHNIRFGIQTPFVQNSVNSKFPVGENNAAAWYGRGHTTEVMAGAYMTSDYFTINIHPHLIYQQNQDFLRPRFIRGEYGNIIDFRIDAPYRFGPDAYWTLDWGYSSVRLHYRQFETGLSSEPQWWGPAVRYPLVMSNNAAGIHHFFIGTREPLSIPYIGDLQFRWILGYPQESDYFEGSESGETRFINAANIAYTPSIFPNLTLGFTRTYHLYEEDGFSFKNVGLIFDPFQQKNLIAKVGSQEEREPRNQIISMYAHVLLPRANAEIYGEFYRGDHSWDTRDFINQPNHNSAWMLGFQKIFFAPFVDFYKVNLEFTNLTMPQLVQVRHQTFHYSHSQIRHGHTNQGQILGAAIGPGSNSQFFSLDAYKDDFKFGILVQRVADNENFHLRQGAASANPDLDDFGDYFRHRINLNLGVNFLYGPGPYYIHSRFMWTKAYNYGRFDYGEFSRINVTNYDRNDLTNVHFQVGVTYAF